MQGSGPNEAGRIQAENRLEKDCRDFSAAYMGVKYLAYHVQNHPLTITDRTIDVLFLILEFQKFNNQKQVFFLYSEVADTIVQAAEHRDLSVSGSIIPRLQGLLVKSSGKMLRAIGQSLGKLPLKLQPTDNLPLSHQTPVETNLDSLNACFNAPPEISYTWKGRSLLLQKNNQILGVIKFATSKSNTLDLVKEIQWMEWLQKTNSSTDWAYQVPIPIYISDRSLFKLSCVLPPGKPDNIYQGICVAFIPCSGYYHYPNQATSDQEQVKKMFFKTAHLLGDLSRKGIFHTALIPLFHNRVQQGRRNDNGAYLWEHGGRLDQWLNSCRYPNFSASGLRDFEHLVTTETTKELRHYIGEYLLSFILVMGSYFRNKAPHRRGWNNQLEPCDTRDLFCPDLFCELLTGVCRTFFHGLVGHTASAPPDLAVSHLVNALINVMGKDEHMEETLRVRDQEDMDDNQFKHFLTERGITQIPVKGKNDIVLETGPHLGGFNQSISVPALIDFLFKYSGLCVSYCFLKENELKH